MTRTTANTFLITAAYALVIPFCSGAPPIRTEVRIEATAEPAGWNVYRDDQLIAGYRIDVYGTPVVYPIVGPGGHRMTRDYPMKAVGPNETDDHPHHRSLWMTYGEVNGIDFWLRGNDHGKVVHRDGIVETNADGTAAITTHNDWMSPAGKRVLSDTRRIAFSEHKGRYIIDFDILLRATDGDVHFGDTKEGAFGLRVAGTMKVDAKLGGTITNAEGEIDGDTWGKKSPWVDYSGPVDGETVGITIHDHPSSFGYPCRWHVRTYGLFAANPFGQYQFTGGEKTNGIVLTQGKQLRLNYRVVLHTGGLDAEVATADSSQFANDPRPVLE